ncbi:MAG: hypothetical protein U0271_42060 [Polyangiaceae bacterium]
MHALAKAAVAVAALSALGLALGRSSERGRAPRDAPSVTVVSASAQYSAIELRPMPCPSRHLPEGDACIPLPGLDEPLREGVPVVGQERGARGPAIEVLPRRPDRPADAALLRFPIDGEPLFLRSPDEIHPAGESPVSVQLAAERGTPIVTLVLDGQDGLTSVLAAGRLIGNTVVTAHHVRALGGEERTILIVHGRLEAVSAEVSAGAKLGAGAVLGYVGDSGSPGIVSLYVEARQVRSGVSLDGLPLKKLLDPSVSVPTDVRNVLSLRE